MSNFVNSITGVFTISIDGREHRNLVVNSGLKNIFSDTSVVSLCESLSVYDDPTEVKPTDTGFGTPIATTRNRTDTVTGVTGTGTSDYFYMRRTWTFTQGQIDGVINKLAIFSDDGKLFAAALLKNEAGELDPVRPLFAPKVEVTYESRWHFKQGDSFTVGTPVRFSDAGMVIVKTNMANKNSARSYEHMDKPFSILDVELFSDAITTDDKGPLRSLGKVASVDYNSIDVTDNTYGVYGRTLNIVLPKDKYINDTPISTILVTTTRGQWQMGFEPPLEKPSLSKRRIEINFPFVHGTVDTGGKLVPTGDPVGLASIFSELINAKYDVSTYSLTYTTGTLEAGTAGFAAKLKDPTHALSIAVSGTEKVTVGYGSSATPTTYLKGNAVGFKGITVSLKPGETLKGYVDGTAFEEAALTISASEVYEISVRNSRVTVAALYSGQTYTTSVTTDFPIKPANTFVLTTNVIPKSNILVQ